MARESGATFVGKEEFLDTVEADMRANYKYWFDTSQFSKPVSKSECEAIISQNALVLMQLVKATKKLGLDYTFDILDPISFVEDLLCLLVREFTKDFLRYSDFADMVLEVKFTFDWRDEYILSKELFDYEEEGEDRRVYRLVMGIIEKSKAVTES